MAASALQIGLATAAWTDLACRPREAVNGRKPDPVVAPGWWTIEAFADHVATPGIRHRVFPVQSFDGKPTGLVSLADLASTRAQSQRQTRLYDAARPLDPDTTARAGEPLADVLRRATPRTNSAFVVVENHVLVGILTTADIMRAMELARLGHRPVQPTGPTQR